MEHDNLAEWEKELRVLLGLIQSQPSKDLTKERERIVVLNKLIAAQAKNPSA